jgi:hypothetical protein
MEKDRDGNGFIEKKSQVKWYFKTRWIIVAFLCIGPFALPLIWFNPRFNQKNKIIITILVVIITYYIGLVFINSLKSIIRYYQDILSIF